MGERAKAMSVKAGQGTVADKVRSHATSTRVVQALEGVTSVADLEATVLYRKCKKQLIGQAANHPLATHPG